MLPEFLLILHLQLSFKYCFPAHFIQNSNKFYWTNLVTCSENCFKISQIANATVCVTSASRLYIYYIQIMKLLAAKPGVFFLETEKFSRLTQTKRKRYNLFIWKCFCTVILVILSYIHANRTIFCSLIIIFYKIKILANRSNRFSETRESFAGLQF